MKVLLVLLCFSGFTLRSMDTLFTHPHYPPIVYEGDEYSFYKYTPKFIPDNLLHSFKILGTIDANVLFRFSNRTTEEVVERGIFDRGYRLRKEFCLESYSPFTQYFHAYGIYSPFAMETYIILAFHQYLREEFITWGQNKNRALKNLEKENKAWKKRARHFYKSFEYTRSQADQDQNPEASEDDWFYAW